MKVSYFLLTPCVHFVLSISTLHHLRLIALPSKPKITNSPLPRT